MDLKILTRWIPLALCLGLISCTPSSFQKYSQGWVLMRYYINKEKGFSGSEPFELGDYVELIQEVFLGSLEELTAVVLESIDLEELPESIGTYRGAALSWDLYSFESQIKELGPMTI